MASSYHYQIIITYIEINNNIYSSKDKNTYLLLQVSVRNFKKVKKVRIKKSSILHS